jgi:hypothetical protein
MPLTPSHHAPRSFVGRRDSVTTAPTARYEVMEKKVRVDK